MQTISTDKSVRSDTLEDLKEFKCHFLPTQAKKGEQIVSMMPAIKKNLIVSGDDIVGLHTENKSLNNKKCSHDKKWLQKSKARLLQQIDDEKRAN